MNDVISAKTKDALGTFFTTYLQISAPPALNALLPICARTTEIEAWQRQHYYELYLAAKHFVESYEANDLKEVYRNA